jgi:hypothetical protein
MNDDCEGTTQQECRETSMWEVGIVLACWFHHCHEDIVLGIVLQYYVGTVHIVFESVMSHQLALVRFVPLDEQSTYMHPDKQAIWNSFSCRSASFFWSSHHN